MYTQSHTYICIYTSTYINILKKSKLIKIIINEKKQ